MRCELCNTKIEKQKTQIPDYVEKKNKRRYEKIAKNNPYYVDIFILFKERRIRYDKNNNLSSARDISRDVICKDCHDTIIVFLKQIVKQKEEKKRMIQTNKQIMKEMGIAPEEFREKDYLWSNNRFTDEELEVFKQKGIIKDFPYKEGMIRLYLRNTYVPPFEESEDLPRVEIIIRRSYKHHGSTCFRLPFESAREFAKEILEFLGDEEVK